MGGVLYIMWWVPDSRRRLIDRQANIRSCLLEVGIFASHLVWLARTRKIRLEAASQGKSFDELATDYEERGIEFKFAERKRGKTARDES
jgi:hypothetical protein